MTGKQHTVLWMGLALILVRLFATTQWSDLWDAIRAGGSGAANSNNSILGGLIPIPKALQGNQSVKPQPPKNGKCPSGEVMNLAGNMCVPATSIHGGH